jgi:hypothetical protein
MTDVEQVARALCATSFHSEDAAISWNKAGEWGDHDKWMKMARAAMSATRRIDAAALHEIYRQQNGQPAATGLYQAADWLEARAKEVSDAD